ncbi:MAG TPA: purine-nucleoside phosphorylase [Chthoniobacterales bacterium]|jgi:purine-nucleoside phosphorylase
MEKNPAIDRLRDWGANFAIVLGSGLSGIVPADERTERIPYSEFDEVPRPSVPGHAGQFVLSEIGTKRIIFAQGRVHLYEGRSAKEVTAIVRVLIGAGVKSLVLTNAAGSLNRSFVPGQWMMLRDHINLTGTSPLVGAAEFVDMTEIYSQRLRDLFARAAAGARLVLHEGVYAGLLGPQYETPAEVRMLQTLGADAVGMSTVLEAIQARALEVEVAGFSCLTNFAAGISATNLSHEEVLETGRSAADSFGRLLSAALSMR